MGTVETLMTAMHVTRVWRHPVKSLRGLRQRCIVTTIDPDAAEEPTRGGGWIVGAPYRVKASS
jgi:uncharacterized protein YcbX